MNLITLDVSVDPEELKVLPPKNEVLKFVAIFMAMPEDLDIARSLLEVPIMRAGKKAKRKLRTVEQINGWVLKRYPRPAVKNLLTDMAKFVFDTKSFLPFVEPDRHAAITKLFETMGPHDGFPVVYLHGDREYIKIAEEKYTEELQELTEGQDFQSAALFLAAIESNYRQKQLRHQSRGDKLKRLKRNYKEAKFTQQYTKQKLERSQGHIKQLKQELCKINQTSDELLDQALQKIEKLENELVSERQMYQELITEYARRANQRDRETEGPSPLANKVVTVIGDESHRTGYGQILEMHQAEMRFCPGIEISNKLKSAVTAADIVIYVTAWMQHKTQELAESVRDPEVPIIRINTAGIASFHRAIEEYVKEQKGA